MKLIESKALATAAASIEFTSIPQTYTDLVILLSQRSTGLTDFSQIVIRFNSDSGANYSRRILTGDGSVAQTFSSSGDTSSRIAFTTPSNATSNTFGNARIYIPNYTSSVAKSVSSDSVAENNATNAAQGLHSALYSGTSAITSFSLFDVGGTNFAIGTTASLYGVLKGSDGIVTTS
jgi:hypothetical protein